MSAMSRQSSGITDDFGFIDLLIGGATIAKKNALHRYSILYSDLGSLQFLVFSLLLYRSDLKLQASDLKFIWFLSFGSWCFFVGFRPEHSGLWLRALFKGP
jgi:hypothetical protein